MLGNLHKMFGGVRLAFRTILENLRKSLESGWKSSENRQKRRHWYVYIINRILHRIHARACNILYVIYTLKVCNVTFYGTQLFTRSKGENRQVIGDNTELWFL